MVSKMFILGAVVALTTFASAFPTLGDLVAWGERALAKKDNNQQDQVVTALVLTSK